MKLNELVCPTCGLKCLTDCAYTTCASCSTLFYASQSRSVDYPQPLSPWVTIIEPQLVPLPQPNIQVTPVWVHPPNPFDCSGTVTVSQDGVTYESWN